MFCFILLGFTVTLGLSEKLSPSISGIRIENYISNAGTKSVGQGINPAVESAYKNMDKFQNVEREISELKMMFEAKGQAMDKEMEKMQAMLDYQQIKLDYQQTKLANQQAKMETMDKEIHKLKDTVSGQNQIINDLKNSKTKVENELKTKISQQDLEIRSLKDDTGLLVNMVTNMEMIKDAMDEHSPDKHSRGNTFSESTDNIGATNDSITDKQNMMTMKTYGLTTVEQNQKLINLKGQLSKRQSVAETKKTKRQISGEIAFSAYLSHYIPHLAPGNTLKCDKIIVNDGNAYSPFTGVFTVPITGVYLLTFTFDIWHAGRYEGLQLLVNNRNIVDAIAEGNNDKHAMSGNTAIIKLTQGEKVWLESFWSSDGEVQSTTSGKLTTFSGVLLY